MADHQGRYRPAGCLRGIARLCPVTCESAIAVEGGTRVGDNNLVGIMIYGIIDTVLGKFLIKGIRFVPHPFFLKNNSFLCRSFGK